MAKVTHQYKGILLDSSEEVWMAMWLEELVKAGYVEYWDRPTLPYTLIQAVKYPYVKETVLKTKTKKEDKEFTLLNDLQYTPDFGVQWTEKAIGKFITLIGKNLDPKSWFFTDHTLRGLVEVKPIFDQNGKTAKFSIIQKIFWQTHIEFVDLIIPEKLFEGTFMPKETMDDFKYKRPPTGKNKGKKTTGDWKTNYIPKTLEEFLNDTQRKNT